MNTVRNLFLGCAILLSGILAAQETVTRKLSSFTQLDASGSFEVLLENGTEESAKIVAEGVSPDKITTEVKGNELRLYMENGNYHNIHVRVYITYKELEAIKKSGSGNLTCNDALSASTFTLTTSGSGNIALNKLVKAGSLRINRSGSGTIKVKSVETDLTDLASSGSGNFEITEGHTKRQSIHLSGSGNISAYGFKSAECDAAISGSGNIDVSVSQLLEGMIAGSGNISYRGEAAVKKGVISGSGRIYKQ